MQIDNQLSDVKLSGRIEALALFKHMEIMWAQNNQFTCHLPKFDSPVRTEPKGQSISWNHTNLTDGYAKISGYFKVLRVW